MVRRFVGWYALVVTALALLVVAIALVSVIAAELGRYAPAVACLLVAAAVIAGCLAIEERER